jgi:hypothetical protein
MKFSNTVLLSLGLATAISSAPAVERTSIPFIPCYVLCPRVLPYVPVCGVDNVTYSECAAQKCYHVDIAYNGECSADNSQQQQKPSPSPLNSFSLLDDCMCPDLYDPVCGADGKFYGSACEAECAGTTVAKDLPDDGTASEEDCVTPLSTLDSMHHGCICPMVYLPVCGADGKIYGNDCEAKCAGTTVTKNLPPNGTEADCQVKHHACVCTMMIYAPVCGADGKVYANDCEAKCAGTTVTKNLPLHGTAADCEVKHHGCICPMIYFPVCGADGKVYSNECEAKCAGTTVTKNLPPNGTEADCKKIL